MIFKVVFATLLIAQISQAQDWNAFCSKINAATVPSFMKCLTDFVPPSLLGFMMECQQDVMPGEITDFVVAACADQSLLAKWGQCQAGKLGSTQLTPSDMQSMEKLVGCVMAI